jgi:hypothetical protein
MPWNCAEPDSRGAAFGVTRSAEMSLWTPEVDPATLIRQGIGLSRFRVGKNRSLWSRLSVGPSCFRAVIPGSGVRGSWQFHEIRSPDSLRCRHECPCHVMRDSSTCPNVDDFIRTNSSSGRVSPRRCSSRASRAMARSTSGLSRKLRAQASSSARSCFSLVIILTIPHPSPHRPCARSPLPEGESHQPRPDRPNSPTSRPFPRPQDYSPRS